MANAKSTDGLTVTREGMQVQRAAGLIEDQLYDVVHDLSVAVEVGICDGLGEESSRILNRAIAQLTELRDQLEFVGYGDAKGLIEVPLAVLFPQLRESSEATG